MGKENNKDLNENKTDFKNKNKNSNRRNSKPNSKKEGFNPRYPRKNDPSWYTKFPDLAKVSCFVNYGVPIGQPIDYGTSLNEDKLQRANAVSGIMKISILPSIGLSTDNNSAVNNMARLIYSDIRHANSGARNYEAQDLMTYYLALGSAYAFYASLVRLYGIMRSYSVDNLYIPQYYCEVLGFKYSDIVKNLANLRSYIGYFAARLNKFAAPKEMSYYEHMLFLPMNIFMDYDDPKASLYLFDFDSLFIWTGTEFETGSGLVLTPWGRTNEKTFDKIQQVGEHIINSLMLNEDIGLMSGDTQKLYGSENLKQLPVISDDYVLTPIYDEDILWQIHNATVLSYDSEEWWMDWVVYQEGQALIFNPHIDITGGQFYSVFKDGFDALIDSGNREPSIEENLENTRLHNRVKFTDLSNNTYAVSFASVSTAVVINCTVYTLAKNYDDNVLTLDRGWLVDFGFDANQSDQYGPVLQRMMNYGRASCFRHKPIIYVYESLADGVGEVIPFGDLHNFTVASTNQIDQLHRTALLSEFYVPNKSKPY